MESTFRGVPAGTRLIETLRWSPNEGAPDIARHLDRMERSALRLGLSCDRDKLIACLGHQMTGPLPLRIRIMLGQDGPEATSSPLPPASLHWRLRIHETRLDSRDPWLSIKSTQRALYDTARADLPADVDEWLFLNERGEVCEGTITNLFVETPDGRRYTPATTCGLLPGILRERLLQDGWEEAVMRPDDLHRARRIWVGNALRGLIEAQLTGFA